MARSCTDPLGHFLLHQEHQALIGRLHGAIQPTHQAFQQRTCDVVRDVGHHLSSRFTVVEQQRQLQHIPLAQAEARLISKASLEPTNQIPIEFHRVNGARGRRQQPLGERPSSRSHLQHTIISVQISSDHDLIQHALILQPVLAESFAGLVTLKPHGFTVHQHSCSRGNQRTGPIDGGSGTTATATCSRQSARSGCSARQQLNARPRRLRLADITARVPHTGVRLPLTSTSSSRRPLITSRSSSPQRQLQFRSRRCQPRRCSSFSTRVSAAIPRSRAVINIGVTAGSVPLQPQWALGFLDPWTLQMRSRLLSLLGALALSILLLAPAPAAHAAIDVAKQVLIGSDYSDKDLRGATFNLSNLREANLSGSDLRGASLYGAKLQDADLSNTDLREATLDSAVLTGTNLSGAVLEGAFAFNTRFKDVVIVGTDFTDVPMRGDQLKSLCAVAEGNNPVTGRSTRDSLGCS